MARRPTKRRGSRSHKRRHSRKQRGGDKLQGAPLSYSLAGDWSSKMSLDQGQDFLKYHANQHGGEAPYPQALQGDAIPSSMVGPSMSTGYYRAFQDVAGLKDASPMSPNPIPLAGVSAAPNPTVQGGGRRRKGKHATRRLKQQQKQLKQQQKQQQQQLKQQQKQQQQQLKQQQKQQQQQLKQQGGAVLGYDSVSAPGLLLPTQSMYNQAGLNPQYYLGTSTEQADAIARDQI